MLNEVEKSFLRTFVESGGMAEAVMKYVLLEAEKIAPNVTNTDSDEILGQRTRALNTAKTILSQIFSDMLKYKGRDKIKNLDNLER